MRCYTPTSFFVFALRLLVVLLASSLIATVAGQPGLVTSGVGNPYPLAVDGNFLHFGQLNGSLGWLFRVSASGGTQGTRLADNSALFDSGWHGISRIVFTPTKVYLGYGGYVTYAIAESNKDGRQQRFVDDIRVGHAQDGAPLRDRLAPCVCYGSGNRHQTRRTLHVVLEESTGAGAIEI